MFKNDRKIKMWKLQVKEVDEIRKEREIFLMCHSLSKKAQF